MLCTFAWCHLGPKGCGPTMQHLSRRQFGYNPKRHFPYSARVHWSTSIWNFTRSAYLQPSSNGWSSWTHPVRIVCTSSSCRQYWQSLWLSNQYLLCVWLQWYGNGISWVWGFLSRRVFRQKMCWFGNFRYPWWDCVYTMWNCLCLCTKSRLRQLAGGR